MQTGELTPLLSASSLVAGQVPFKKTLGLLLEQRCGNYPPVYSLLWVPAAELLLTLAFMLCLKMAPRGRYSRNYAGLIRYSENSSASRSTKRGARAGTYMSHGEFLFPSMEPPCFSLIFVVWLLSRVRIFETPWTVAYLASPSMGFSRQESWNGLPLPSPRDLPDTGIEPGCPALQADTFTV